MKALNSLHWGEGGSILGMLGGFVYAIYHGHDPLNIVFLAWIFGLGFGVAAASIAGIINLIRTGKALDLMLFAIGGTIAGTVFVLRRVPIVAALLAFYLAGSWLLNMLGVSGGSQVAMASLAALGFVGLSGSIAPRAPAEERAEKRAAT